MITTGLTKTAGLVAQKNAFLHGNFLSPENTYRRKITGGTKKGRTIPDGGPYLRFPGTSLHNQERKAVESEQYLGADKNALRTGAGESQ